MVPGGQTNIVCPPMTQCFRSAVTVAEPFEQNTTPKASMRVGNRNRSMMAVSRSSASR